MTFVLYISVLAEDAIQAALNDWKKKNTTDPDGGDEKMAAKN